MTTTLEHPSRTGQATDGAVPDAASGRRAVDPTIDPREMRRALGHYPTGVAVVTALYDGAPTGFVVGTFTSISLEPPLVGFFADQRSSTFPRIQEAGSFCANVLGAGDDDVCRLFSAKGVDRFAQVDWRHGVTGSPVLRRSTLWVDCRLQEVREVGDHLLAVGRVVELGLSEAQDPLIFHRAAFSTCAS